MFPAAWNERTFLHPADSKAWRTSVMLTTPLPPTFTARRSAMWGLTGLFVSGARMCLAIHVEQLRGVHVRVPLRRRELHVSKQLLDRAKVGAALEQVRCERVPQRVRADAEARA